MTLNDTEQLDKKRICFLLDVFEPSFIEFATRCQTTPQALLNAIEEAILTRHRDAQPGMRPGIPRPIWRLEIEAVSFSYQILPGEIEVGGLVSKLDGWPYEPRQDLLADFSE